MSFVRSVVTVPARSLSSIRLSVLSFVPSSSSVLGPSVQSCPSRRRRHHPLSVHSSRRPSRRRRPTLSARPVVRPVVVVRFLSVRPPHPSVVVRPPSSVRPSRRRRSSSVSVPSSVLQDVA